MHHTLTAMIKTYGDEPLPLVAILRGGTMNTIAQLVRHLRRVAQAALRAGRPPPTGIAGHDPVVRARDPAGRRRLRLHLRQRHHLQLPARVLRDGRALAGDGGAADLRAAGSTMVGGPLAKRIYRRFRARVVVDGDAGPARTSSPSPPRWSSRSASASSRSTGCDERPDASRSSASTPTPRLRRRAAAHHGRRADAARQGDRRRRARSVVLRVGRELEYIIDGDTYVADRAAGPGESARSCGCALTGNAASDEADSGDCAVS